MPETEILQKDLNKQIFNNIKAEIARQGFQNKDLAAEFGVSPSEYSRAIHGDSSPKAKRLRKKTYKKLGME